jgi:hypothetical protein
VIKFEFDVQSSLSLSYVVFILVEVIFSTTIFFPRVGEIMK